MSVLTELANGKTCVLCGRNDGSTVLHHIRVAGNAGVGNKPPDFPWGVRLCGGCHHYFHHSGRADFRMMVTAMGRQMTVYASEGVIKLSPKDTGK